MQSKDPSSVRMTRLGVYILRLGCYFEKYSKSSFKQ
jgi:hypothetical protein